MSQTAQIGREMTGKRAVESITLVDCDVHPIMPNGIRDLAPYLSSGWKARFGLAGNVGTDQHGGTRQATIELPRSPFYFPTPGAFRKDSIPPDGGIPASDPHFVAQHHLDTQKVDRAILLGQNALTLGAMVNPDFARVIAAASNDWLEATWLEADHRYRGAIIVVPHDGAKAADEIRRVAARSNSWVSVMVPLSNVMMGDHSFHPIYEAAEELGLPVTVHISGVEGTYPSAPALGGGTPATYFEFKSTYTTAYQANLASLIIRGIFERFPKLKIVFSECGLGWIPELMLRMDSNWKALRDEAPWVKKAPSEYILEHVRFTSQPFVEPPTGKQTREFCEMIRADRTLMFASDYPHYDFDDPLRTLALIPRDSRDAVSAGNALELFGDRLTAVA